jgi:uncharacterized FlaG/YvyC family protein
MEVDSLKAIANASIAQSAYAPKPAAVSHSAPKAEPATNGKDATAEKSGRAGANLRVLGNAEKEAKALAEVEIPAVEDESVSNEFFDKLIREANDKIFMSNRQFDYSFHEPTNRVAIKVLDRTTKEVIKETSRRNKSLTKSVTGFMSELTTVYKAPDAMDAMAEVSLQAARDTDVEYTPRILEPVGFGNAKSEAPELANTGTEGVVIDFSLMIENAKRRRENV